MRRALAAARAELARRLLGVTAEEIRYTFEDVRKELHATRQELLDDIAELRREVDILAGRGGQESAEDTPIAEA